MMPLLNYTTSIAPHKTVGEIQQMLARAGARSILQDYDDEGFIIALSFKMSINGVEVAYRLPSAWQPVQAVLERDPRVPQRLKSPEQALRVSWRIVKDWVEAQLAIIEAHIVKPQEVFLPYMITNNNKTLYERFEENPRLLEGGTND